MLDRLGYEDVGVLVGGLRDSAAAGGAVETGRNVPSKRFGEQVLAEDEALLIEPDDLVTLLGSDDPPAVLDVRTPAEHARERIPTAQNCPGFEVVGAAQELVRGGRQVVVHCTGRTRSIIAARTLRLAGMGTVRALRDGTMGWLLAGHEVDRGEAPTVAEAARGKAPVGPTFRRCPAWRGRRPGGDRRHPRFPRPGVLPARRSGGEHRELPEWPAALHPTNCERSHHGRRAWRTTCFPDGR
jgi:rhodanese-related sulfurtransferase